MACGKLPGTGRRGNGRDADAVAIRASRARDDILFDFDRHEVRREARPTLAKLAELIEITAGAKVLVEGHTDAKGSGSYNQSLSERRAQAVAAWLADRHGIEAARLEERGYGESHPVAPNTDPDGRDSP